MTGQDNVLGDESGDASEFPRATHLDGQLSLATSVWTHPHTHTQTQRPGRVGTGPRAAIAIYCTLGGGGFGKSGARSPKHRFDRSRRFEACNHARWARSLLITQTMRWAPEDVPPMPRPARRLTAGTLPVSSRPTRRSSTSGMSPTLRSRNTGRCEMTKKQHRCPPSAPPKRPRQWISPTNANCLQYAAAPARNNNPCMTKLVTNQRAAKLC